MPTAMPQMCSRVRLKKAISCLNPSPSCPDQVGGRDSHVREGDLRRIIRPDAQLAVEFVGLVPGPVGLHDEE